MAESRHPTTSLAPNIKRPNHSLRKTPQPLNQNPQNVLLRYKNPCSPQSRSPGKIMVQSLCQTLSTFLAQPKTKPAQEFIDGKIIPKPIPKGEHSRLQQELIAVLNLYLEDPKIGLARPKLRGTAPLAIAPSFQTLPFLPGTISPKPQTVKFLTNLISHRIGSSKSSAPINLPPVLPRKFFKSSTG